MSIYWTRIYHNDKGRPGAGEAIEYELPNDSADGLRPALDDQAITLRLLEAQAYNLASIAQSLDRIADVLYNWEPCV